MSFHRDDPRDDWVQRDESDRPDPSNRRRSGPTDKAHSAVKAPEVILIVLGLLNLLGALPFLGGGVAVRTMSVEEYEEMMTEDDPEALNEYLDQGWTVEGLKNATSYLFLGVGMGSMLAGVVLLFGGVGMFTLKHYWLAILASITAVVSPAGCGCLLFGLVGGIWSFIVLINPDVRKAFR